MRRLMKTAIIAGAGAAAAYFFDPDRGVGRRHQLRDQARSNLRKGTERVQRRTRYQEGRLAGLEAEAAGKGQPHPGSDREVVDLVKQELGRLELDTSQVVVDVAEGVATLRGQVGDATAKATLEAEVARVPGVTRVENLAHLPGEPAPTKAASLDA